MPLISSILRNNTTTKLVLIITSVAIVFSVLLTNTLMVYLGASWFTVGTTLAIICPLLGAPPIIYFFVKFQKDLAESNKKLQIALTEVKILSGLLPICSNCKDIRNTHDSWIKLESYIEEYSDVNFNHSICPKCINKLYPELVIKNQ